MREHGLQPRRRPHFVAATDSGHNLSVFPNLAREWNPTVPTSSGSPTSPYVAVVSGFVYVARVIDAWSRRIVGWAISRPRKTLGWKTPAEALDSYLRSPRE